MLHPSPPLVSANTENANFLNSLDSGCLRTGEPGTD